MIKIHLLDHINFQIEGITSDDIAAIIDKTKLPVPGAFQTAGYQTGNWDGMESLFDERGFGFIAQLETIFDILISRGYSVDDIELVDDRPKGVEVPLIQIEDDFLLDETGYRLRYYQTDAINLALERQQGVIEAATSAGKASCSLGISKALDPYLKVVLMAPSNYLVDQLYKDYQKTDLSVVRLGKLAPGKRQAAIAEYRHFIMTYKMMLNSAHLFKDEEFAIILDECHFQGEQFADVLRFDLAHCRFRIGMTATLPRDKLKRERIICHIGNGPLLKVSQKELTDNGYASLPTLQLLKTYHPSVEELSDGPLWDWEMEARYYNTNELRLAAIADYIKSLPLKNTLILCQASAGDILATFFNGNMIRDETPDDKRKEWLGMFDTATKDNPHYQCASFGTAGTGVSVNTIRRVVLVDIGKPETLILQAIGRGMRLDEESGNKVDVIDISANLKYGNRHQKERIKLYKRESFIYHISNDKIHVTGDE